MQPASPAGAWISGPGTFHFAVTSLPHAKIYGVHNVEKPPEVWPPFIEKINRAAGMVLTESVCRWLGNYWVERMPKSMLKAFFHDESGATAIEYALIASIISISIVIAATALRGELQNSYQGVATGLKNATN